MWLYYLLCQLVGHTKLCFATPAHPQATKVAMYPVFFSDFSHSITTSFCVFDNEQSLLASLVPQIRKSQPNIVSEDARRSTYGGAHDVEGICARNAF